jgi:hypothetical protein
MTTLVCPLAWALAAVHGDRTVLVERNEFG